MPGEHHRVERRPVHGLRRAVSAEDAQRVPPRDARLETHLARAVASLHRLDLRRSDARNLHAEGEQVRPRGHDVAEAIEPRDPRDAARARGEPLELGRVHAALPRIRGSRRARPFQRQTRRLRREHEQKRTGDVHRVRTRVRPVALVEHGAAAGFRTGDLHLKRQRRAARDEPVPARVARLDDEACAFAGDASRSTGADDAADGQVHVRGDDADARGGPDHGVTVQRRHEDVLSHLRPAHGGSEPRAVFADAQRHVGGDARGAEQTQAHRLAAADFAAAELVIQRLNVHRRLDTHRRARAALGAAVRAEAGAAGERVAAQPGAGADGEGVGDGAALRPGDFQSQLPSVEAALHGGEARQRRRILDAVDGDVRAPLARARDGEREPVRAVAVVHDVGVRRARRPEQTHHHVVAALQARVPEAVASHQARLGDVAHHHAAAHHQGVAADHALRRVRLRRHDLQVARETRHGTPAHAHANHVRPTLRRSAHEVPLAVPAAGGGDERDVVRSDGVHAHFIRRLFTVVVRRVVAILETGGVAEGVAREHGDGRLAAGHRHQHASRSLLRAGETHHALRAVRRRRRERNRERRAGEHVARQTAPPPPLRLGGEDAQRVRSGLLRAEARDGPGRVRLGLVRADVRLHRTRALAVRHNHQNVRGVRLTRRGATRRRRGFAARVGRSRRSALRGVGALARAPRRGGRRRVGGEHRVAETVAAKDAQFEWLTRAPALGCARVGRLHRARRRVQNVRLARHQQHAALAGGGELEVVPAGSRDFVPNLVRARAEVDGFRDDGLDPRRARLGVALALGRRPVAVRVELGLQEVERRDDVRAAASQPTAAGVGGLEQKRRLAPGDARLAVGAGDVRGGEVHDGARGGARADLVRRDQRRRALGDVRGKRRHHAVGGVHGELVQHRRGVRRVQPPRRDHRRRAIGGELRLRRRRDVGVHGGRRLRGGEGVHLGEHRRQTRRDVARRVRDVPGPGTGPRVVRAGTEIARVFARGVGVGVGARGAEPVGGVAERAGEGVVLAVLAARAEPPATLAVGERAGVGERVRVGPAQQRGALRRLHRLAGEPGVHGARRRRRRLRVHLDEHRRSLVRGHLLQHRRHHRGVLDPAGQLRRDAGGDARDGVGGDRGVQRAERGGSRLGVFGVHRRQKRRRHARVVALAVALEASSRLERFQRRRREGATRGAAALRHRRGHRRGAALRAEPGDQVRRALRGEARQDGALRVPGQAREQVRDGASRPRDALLRAAHGDVHHRRDVRRALVRRALAQRRDGARRERGAVLDATLLAQRLQDGRRALGPNADERLEQAVLGEPRQRCRGAPRDHVLNAGVGPTQVELAEDVGGALSGHRAEVRAELRGGHRLQHGDARFARALRERGDGLLRLHGAHRRRGGGRRHRVNHPARGLRVHARQHRAAGGGAHVGERLRGNAGGHAAQRPRGALGRGGARFQAASAERERGGGGVDVALAVRAAFVVASGGAADANAAEALDAVLVHVRLLRPLLLPPRAAHVLHDDAVLGGDGGGGGGGSGGGLQARRGVFRAVSTRLARGGARAEVFVLGVPHLHQERAPGQRLAVQRHRDGVRARLDPVHRRLEAARLRGEARGVVQSQPRGRVHDHGHRLAAGHRADGIGGLHEHHRGFAQGRVSVGAHPSDHALRRRERRQAGRQEVPALRVREPVHGNVHVVLRGLVENHDSRVRAVLVVGHLRVHARAGAAALGVRAPRAREELQHVAAHRARVPEAVGGAHQKRQRAACGAVPERVAGDDALVRIARPGDNLQRARPPRGGAVAHQRGDRVRSGGGERRGEGADDVQRLKGNLRRTSRGDGDAFASGPARFVPGDVAREHVHQDAVARHHRRRERDVGVRLAQALLDDAALAVGDEQRDARDARARKRRPGGDVGFEVPNLYLLDVRGVRHRQRHDGHVVRARGARAQPQLARAVAELNRLAVARAGAHHLGGEPVACAGVARRVAEAVLARDAHDGGVARRPVKHELARVHAALRGLHLRRDALHGEHAHGGVVLPREHERDFQRTSLVDAVGKLVRAVAVIDDVAGHGVLAGHARLEHQRRAAAQNRVPAVVARDQPDVRHLPGDAPRRALALQRGHRQTNLDALGARAQGRARHAHAIQEHGDSVLAGMKPPDGRGVVRHVLAEDARQRLLRASRLEQTHGDRLETRHEPAVLAEPGAGDDQLARRAALVHAVGPKMIVAAVVFVVSFATREGPGRTRGVAPDVHDRLLGGERAEGHGEANAALHAGLAVDARAHVPAAGDGRHELERVRAVGVVDNLHGARERAAGALERELDGVVAVQAQVAVPVRRLQRQAARVAGVQVLEPLHGDLAPRRVRRPRHNLHGAPADGERVDDDPQLKRAGAHHARQVVGFDAGGAGDGERHELGPARLHGDVLTLPPVRVVAEAVLRQNLHQDLVPGRRDPGVVLLARADHQHVARRAVRRAGAHGQVELAVGQGEHRAPEQAAKVGARHRGAHHAAHLHGRHRRPAARGLGPALGHRLGKRVRVERVGILRRLRLFVLRRGGAHRLVVHANGEVVHAGDGPREAQLAGAVSELERLAGDLARPGADAVERREALSSRHAVAESVGARHRQRQLLPRRPAAVRRALHAAALVIHLARLAVRAEGGRLRAQKQTHLVRARLLDEVRSLVRPVAAVHQLPAARLAAHAHGDAHRRPSPEQPVAPRVARLDEDHGAFAGDGAG